MKHKNNILNNLQDSVYGVIGCNNKDTKIITVKNNTQLNLANNKIQFGLLASKLKIGPTIYDVKYLKNNKNETNKIQVVIHKVMIVKDFKLIEDEVLRLPDGGIIEIFVYYKIKNGFLYINYLEDDDKENISLIFKKLFNYSKKNIGFFPTKFSFAVIEYKQQHKKWFHKKWFITNCDLIKYNNKEQFIEKLKKYLNNSKTFEQKLVLQSLQYYNKKYNDDFSKILGTILK